MKRGGFLVPIIGLVICIGLCDVAAQPVVLEGAGQLACVNGLRCEWKLVLGWPNTTVAQGTGTEQRHVCRTWQNTCKYIGQLPVSVALQVFSRKLCITTQFQADTFQLDVIQF
jgi:hypothetical protein